jgi:hypothetical protein
MSRVWKMQVYCGLSRRPAYHFRRLLSQSSSDSNRNTNPNEQFGQCTIKVDPLESIEIAVSLTRAYTRLSRHIRFKGNMAFSIVALSVIILKIRSVVL